MAGDPSRFDDLFSDYGPISVRRFFGGEAIWDGKAMIALVWDERLYFTTSDASRAAFEAESCKPFSFARGKRVIETSWFAIPERLYDDPAELAQWARVAREASLLKIEKKKRDAKKKAGQAALVSSVAMRGSFCAITMLRPLRLAPYKQASARRTTASLASPAANWATPMEMVIVPRTSPVDFLTSFFVCTVSRICSATRAPAAKSLPRSNTANSSPP
jgi:DNA transformation protein